MKDIIKAQLYQLKKERIICVIFVVTLFLQCTMMIGELDLMNASDASAGFYAAGAGSNIIIMSLMFAMMLTGIICSSDFMDKTANYELMCGHLRKDMFFGRVVPGLIIGTAGTMIISAAPIILCSILYGWGNTVSPGDLFTRWVLSISPIFRVIMNYGDLVFTIVEILFAAGLYLFAGFAAKVQSSKWKLCYAVPFLVALFTVTILGFEISMLGIYAGALLLLTGFVREEKKTRKMVSLLAGIAMVFSVVVCHVDAGYRIPCTGLYLGF